MEACGAVNLLNCSEEFQERFCLLEDWKKRRIKEEEVSFLWKTFITRETWEQCTSPDVPEVLEGGVDVEAPAVHISDVGSGQFHLSNGQAGFVILEKHKLQIKC